MSDLKPIDAVVNYNEYFPTNNMHRNPKVLIQVQVLKKPLYYLYVFIHTVLYIQYCLDYYEGLLSLSSLLL